MMRACPLDLVARLHAFAGNRRGAAAIEFAALLPLMLALYIGGVEVSDGIAIDRKVAITARAVADLASRYTAVYNADMSTILSASSVVIAPYGSANLTVTVSELTTDANGHTTVTWSDTLNGTARTVGSSVTLPGTLAVNGASLILGEVSYAYTPSLGYVLTGTWPLSSQIFMSPRNSGSVSRINS